MIKTTTRKGKYTYTLASINILRKRHQKTFPDTEQGRQDAEEWLRQFLK